jgi:hypothetical protein
MLLAADTYGAPLTYQAVGLEFDERDRFRSRCLVLWGPVRRLADVPGEGEERVKSITAQMAADLEDLLVAADTHEERHVIARVAEMLANDAGDESLSGWSTIGRQVDDAAVTLRDADPTLVARVRERLQAYYDELARLGRTDAQVSSATASVTKPPARWLSRAALAPLAVPGLVLYFIPYWIPRLVAERTARDSEDDVSTIKLGVALVIYPLWAAGLIGLSFTLIPPPLSLLAAVVVVASPFAALRWLDAYWERTVHHDATPDELANLARLRIAARTAIDEARSRLSS